MYAETLPQDILYVLLSSLPSNLTYHVEFLTAKHLKIWFGSSGTCFVWWKDCIMCRSVWKPVVQDITLSIIFPHLPSTNDIDLLTAK